MKNINLNSTKQEDNEAILIIAKLRELDFTRMSAEVKETLELEITNYLIANSLFNEFGWADFSADDVENCEEISLDSAFEIIERKLIGYCWTRLKRDSNGAMLLNTHTKQRVG